jgi:hypothetical protein
MDFTNFNLEQFMGFGDDSNPLLWLIWIIPIVLFIFYGQRIQLQVTSSEIKKNISKLKQFKDESRNELINYIKKNLKPTSDPISKLDRFIDYFTIMPVDMDPNGIIPKVRHVVRSREDNTREQVKSLFSEISELERTKVQTLLEVVTSLQLLYKVVNHLYLTAKKQHNYPLILPLQMMMPFIMEEANALNDAVPTLKQGQPIGDGIGPMVVGKMMLDSKKQKVSYETVLSETAYEGRKLFLMKAEGPMATVGRPGDAIESLVPQNKPDVIIMIDAALKLEGEDSASVAQGFGAVIGGIGTDRFQIEEVATKHNIPVFAIVIKQSVKEAINLMTKEIAERAEEVRTQIYEIIKDNTKSGQSVLVVGVGNTLGVSQ